MIRTRALTDRIDVNETGIVVDFSRRVEAMLNKGFEPRGSIKLTYNESSHYLKAGQGIEGHFEGEWDGFTAGADIPELDPKPQTSTLYRLVAGKDDVHWCKLVEKMRNEGWEEQGEFAIGSTHTKDVTVQALVKRRDVPYAGFDLNA